MNRWDRPCYKCRSHFCDLSCPEPEKQEPVGQLQEEFFGRGQVMWFKKPDDQTMLYTHPPKREPSNGERLELIGHADLTINNIHIFNGYGEDVPDGRVPIYAGYKPAHPPKRVPLIWDEIYEAFMQSDMEGTFQREELESFARAIEAAHGIKGNT